MHALNPYEHVLTMLVVLLIALCCWVAQRLAAWLQERRDADALAAELAAHRVDATRAGGRLTPSRPDPTSAAGRRWSTGRVALVAAVVTTLGACLFAGARLARMDVPPPPSASNVFTTTYDPPQTRLETMIDVADGQAYATLARDPTFSRTAPFKDGPAEMVYRSQRPLYAWLIWAGSGGRPAAVPVAQFVVTVLSVGALAASAVWLAATRRRVRGWAALVVLLPGCALSVVDLIPEPLSVALAVVGVIAWTASPRRAGWAVASLTLAVASREWLVLVPAVLALHDLLVRREPWRRQLPLAVPPLVLGAWVLSLRVRHGYWPSQAASLERLSAPFLGWYHAVGQLDVAATAAYLGAAVLLVLGLQRHPRSVLVWVEVAFALSTVVLGANVLGTESYRPLLAMYVFGLVAVLPVDAGAPAVATLRAAA